LEERAKLKEIETIISTDLLELLVLLRNTHYNALYTETVLLIYPCLQTNITSRR